MAISGRENRTNFDQLPQYHLSDIDFFHSVWPIFRHFIWHRRPRWQDLANFRNK
jgi:hypothetical protein